MLSNHALGLVYISGPMTGVDDHGASTFTQAREQLRSEGYSVLCPSEASIAHNAAEKRSREFHLRRDISMVLLSDQVCVLPGWEGSKGAAIEVMVAVALGILVWEYDTREIINDAVLEAMDPRRFIMPIDFEEWYSPDEHEPTDLERAVAETCKAMHVPFRGASLSHCNLANGHRGVHRDGGGREWEE